MGVLRWRRRFEGGSDGGHARRASVQSRPSSSGRPARTPLSQPGRAPAGGRELKRKKALGEAVSAPSTIYGALVFRRR